MIKNIIKFQVFAIDRCTNEKKVFNVFAVTPFEAKRKVQKIDFNAEVTCVFPAKYL